MDQELNYGRAPREEDILRRYDEAKRQYADAGVDADAAICAADAVPVSMHCWQGDDVLGFDGAGSLSGGIQTTGSYPGRAATPEQLRADIAFAHGLIPGRVKLNLHACYAEKNGKAVDRDAYTAELFQNWIDFAAQEGMGLDFNPTFFSHPRMDGNFSLSSPDEGTRRFWIEHGKRCREIGLAFAEALHTPCAVNFWMPDGYKDVCADTARHRDWMRDSLDEIFSEPIDRALVPCGLESKLFGVGVESYTVASHEFSYGYAVKNGLYYTLDAGHFHPTEVISAKLSACMPFLPGVILHVSRGVRWDSDHVIVLDSELQRIMDEIVLNGYVPRTCLALDYFDASINRVAAWAIGMRNARKALLAAYLAPGAIRAAEYAGDWTARLALQEERKTLPLGAVWDYYCLKCGVPAGTAWLEPVRRYERQVLSNR